MNEKTEIEYETETLMEETASIDQSQSISFVSYDNWSQNEHLEKKTILIQLLPYIIMCLSIVGSASFFLLQAFFELQNLKKIILMMLEG